MNTFFNTTTLFHHSTLQMLSDVLAFNIKQIEQKRTIGNQNLRLRKRAVLDYVGERQKAGVI